MDINEMRRRYREKKAEELSNHTSVQESINSTINHEEVAIDNKPTKSGDPSTVSLGDCSYYYEKGSNVVTFSCSRIDNACDESTGMLSLCCWISEKPRENGDWQNDDHYFVDSINLFDLKKGYGVSNIEQAFEIPENLLDFIDDMNDYFSEWHFVFTINELNEDGNEYIIYTVNGKNENEGKRLQISDNSLNFVKDNDGNITIFVDNKKFTGIIVSSDERCEFEFEDSIPIYACCFHKNWQVSAEVSFDDEDDTSFYYDENGNEISEEVFESRYGSEFEKIMAAGLEELESRASYKNEEVNNQSNTSSYHKNSSVFSTVKAIIVDKLGVDPDEVVESASFTNDLGADSLDAVEIIMEFEKEFNISIPDDQAIRIRTVGDAVRYIEANI